MLNLVYFIGLSLLLLSGGTWGQSGYNYARPDISNAAGGSSATSSTAVRPLVPLTNNAINAPTNVGVGYPSATASGYGGTAGAIASPFAGFATQPSAIGATGATAYNAPTGASALQTVGGGFNAPKRPIFTAQQRGSGIGGGSANVYGGGLANIGGGQSAYSNAARVSGLNNVDYSGEGDYSAIPGVPAVDYPVYAQVPQTNFDCAQQLPGYYSDVEAQCQVFHICALNRTYSFLCPNGTIFSQETLVCVWWNQFECGTAPALYSNNAYIYDYSNDQQPQLASTYSGSSNTAQLGARQQPTYPGASTSTALRTGPASLPTASGIFGAGNLRANAYGALPSTVTPVPSTTGYGANAVSNVARFAPGSLSAPQSFNSPATPTQATYGSGNVGGGTSGLSPSASSSNVNNNREYLPPAQQQRRP